MLSPTWHNLCEKTNLKLNIEKVTRLLKIQENFNIEIKNYDNLHSTVILMKPNEARLTPSLEYCITELLNFFPKKFASNIGECVVLMIFERSLNFSFLCDKCKKHLE